MHADALSTEGMLFEVLDMVVQKLIKVQSQPRLSSGSLKMFLKAFKLNVNLVEHNWNER